MLVYWGKKGRHNGLSEREGLRAKDGNRSSERLICPAREVPETLGRMGENQRGEENTKPRKL